MKFMVFLPSFLEFFINYCWLYYIITKIKSQVEGNKEKSPRRGEIKKIEKLFLRE